MTIIKIPVWLDCDPGHDDAVVILLACFHPAFDLKGISTCYGNSNPDNTDYNARSLLTAMGKAHKVPVYRGAQHPLIRKPHYAPDIHGVSGLDGTTLLPTPTFEDQTDTDYIHAIEREILNNEAQLSFISTGSMTSITNVMKYNPLLKEKIKYISIMGGGLGVGNKNENLSAEFNVWIDPHASNYLFHDLVLKNKIILCPLNLTHTAIATESVMNNIRGNTASPSNLRKMFYELFLFFKQTYKDHQNFANGPPLHDPITLYPLLELYGWESNNVVEFTYKRMELDVVDDLKSHDVGKLVCTKEYLDDDVDASNGVMVAFHVDIEYFWEQIFKCLDEAEKHSTIEGVL